MKTVPNLVCRVQSSISIPVRLPAFNVQANGNASETVNGCVISVLENVNAHERQLETCCVTLTWILTVENVNVILILTMNALANDCGYENEIPCLALCHDPP
jgi:hypothetical protein